MRILIANYEYPPLGGGGGRASSWIARELVAMGHQVGVLTAGHQLQQTGYTVEQGVRVWRLAAYRPHLDRTGFARRVPLSGMQGGFCRNWSRNYGHRLPFYSLLFPQPR